MVPDHGCSAVGWPPVATRLGNMKEVCVCLCNRPWCGVRRCGSGAGVRIKSQRSRSEAARDAAAAANPLHPAGSRSHAEHARRHEAQAARVVPLAVVDLSVRAAAARFTVRARRGVVATGQAAHVAHVARVIAVGWEQRSEKLRHLRANEFTRDIPVCVHGR